MVLDQRFGMGGLRKLHLSLGSGIFLGCTNSVVGRLGFGVSATWYFELGGGGQDFEKSFEYSLDGSRVPYRIAYQECNSHGVRGFYVIPHT